MKVTLSANCDCDWSGVPLQNGH